MARSTLTAQLPYQAETVWAVVTDLEDTVWRSDLHRVEVLSPTAFIEYDNQGHATHFTVTDTQPPHRWAFTMEGETFAGQWTGEFQPVPAGVRLTFTEEITPKRWWMALFLPVYLRRQQRRYLADLRRALAHRAGGNLDNGSPTR